MNSIDDDYAAWTAYGNAKKRREQRGGAVGAKNKADKERWSGETQKTGRRNRRYSWNSGHYLLPECPQRGTAQKNSASAPSPPRASDRPAYASIHVESITDVQEEGLPSQGTAEEI